MKRFTLRPAGLRGPGPRIGILIALVAAAVALVAAGCGSSNTTPAASSQGRGATSMQVLTPVQRGNLVQSAAGSVKLVKTNGKTVAVATVARQFASSVAAGQTAAVMFFQPRSGAQSGTPFPRSSASGAPFGQSGQGGFGQGGFGGAAARGRGTPGTVTAVKTNADGSATATIAVKKLPATVTAKSIGFATIQTKVLASNAIVIPTAAIKGSGSSATVQVLAGGKTSRRSIVVGQQAGGSRRFSPGSLSARTSSGHARSSAAASSVAVVAARSPGRVSRGLAAAPAVASPAEASSDRPSQCGHPPDVGLGGAQ